MKNIIVLLKLIRLLTDGAVYSGERFAEILGVSPSIIPQYIQTVRDWGLDVFTVFGQGYCLHTPLQLLDESEILAKLPAGRLVILPVIDSTNQYLIERIAELQPGDACVAEYQAHGRGRHGRQWISPFGKNIYLSVYWCLQQRQAIDIGLSLTVGIVIAEFLQRLGAHGVRIKWPNDLYLDDRKVAGILVEIVYKAGEVAHIVIGVGINLTMNVSAAGKINQNWINLQEAGIPIDRNAMVAELTDALRQALWQFEWNGFTLFVSRWQALDNFYARPVRLLSGDRIIKGISRGIDVRGALLLEKEGGVRPYCCGEVSLYTQ